MTTWSEWTRHDGGEKPEHVPDDAIIRVWSAIWNNLEGDNGALLTKLEGGRAGSFQSWPTVNRYRYEIKPKVETVTIPVRIVGPSGSERRWYVEHAFDASIANARLTFEVRDGVRQLDTLRAAPAE